MAGRGKPMSENFMLDERLAADSFPLGRLALCELRLLNDSRFPWLLLVPMRARLVEVIDLEVSDRTLLMQELGRAAESLKKVTCCHKLNVAALGNQVRQLHIHVIARFEGDAAWPNPVWGRGGAQPYSGEAAAEFSTEIRATLGLR